MVMKKWDMKRAANEGPKQMKTFAQTKKGEKVSGKSKKSNGKGNHTSKNKDSQQNGN